MQTPQDPEESVEELLFEYLERHETEGPSAFEDIVRRSPSMRDRLQKRIDALQKAGLLGAGDTQEDFPERMGEFDLKERLGGGGMGIVFRAEQTSLGREVAVKLVRPEQLYFGEVRQRFQREVEAVARLNHPGNRADLLGRRTGRRPLLRDAARFGLHPRRRHPLARGQRPEDARRQGPRHGDRGALPRVRRRRALAPVRRPVARSLPATRARGCRSAGTRPSPRRPAPRRQTLERDDHARRKGNAARLRVGDGRRRRADDAHRISDRVAGVHVA